MTKAEKALERAKRQLKTTLDTVDHLIEIEHKHEPKTATVHIKVPKLDIKALLIQELSTCNAPIRLSQLTAKITKSVKVYNAIHRTIKANGEIFIQPTKGSVVLRHMYTPKGPVIGPCKKLELTGINDD